MAKEKRILKLYACENLRKELERIQPPYLKVEVEYMDYGYHRFPQKLPPVLQEKLEEDRDYDWVLLGYGLCSKAVAGLKAVHQPLIIPRVDDCIALFLGSRSRYRDLFSLYPDTYFLTRGWLDEGEDPLTKYQQWVEKFGKDTAQWLKGEMYRHYGRVCLLDTGVLSSSWHQGKAAEVAAFLGIGLEVWQGDLRLMENLLQGPWNDEFLVVEPGKVVKPEDFY